MEDRRYYDFRVKMNRVQDDGVVKKVVEEYIVRAKDMVGASERLMGELAGEDVVEIMSVRKIDVRGAFVIEETVMDKWYKARWGSIIQNEKLKMANSLVRAIDFRKAEKVFEAGMRELGVEYKVLSIDETKVVDVFV